MSFRKRNVRWHRVQPLPRVLTSVNVTRLGAARSDDLLVVSASANTQSEATAAINLDSRTHKLRWLRKGWPAHDMTSVGFKAWSLSYHPHELRCSVQQQQLQSARRPCWRGRVARLSLTMLLTIAAMQAHWHSPLRAVCATDASQGKDG